jgi:hypothetical protein
VYSAKLTSTKATERRNSPATQPHPSNISTTFGGDIGRL